MFTSPSVPDNPVALHWNNLEYVKKAFQSHPNEIAAILTEPAITS